MLTARPWAFLTTGSAGRMIDRVSAEIAADSRAMALLRDPVGRVVCDLKLRVKSSGSPAVKSLYWSVQAPGPGRAGSLLARTLVADPDRMAWFDLPFDPALPALARLHHRKDDLQILRYVPMRRATMVRHPADAPAQIIKVKRPDRAADAARRLVLAKAALGKNCGFHSPTLVDIRPDGCMTLSHCPGAPLGAEVPLPPAPVLRDIGRMHARLHRCVAPGLPPGATSEPDLPLIAALRPDLAPALASLQDRLRYRPAASPPRLCHGDFGLDQILLGPAGLSLVDFDRCHMGEAAADMARFLVALAETPPAGLNATTAQAAYLAGYRDVRDPPDPVVLDWFVARACVGRLLVCLRKDQPQAVDRLLARACLPVPA